MQDLYKQFGTPQKAAEEILASLDAAQLQQQLRRYRWRKIFAILVVGLALAYVLFYCGRIAVDKIVNPPYVIIEAAKKTDAPLPTNPPFPTTPPK